MKKTLKLRKFPRPYVDPKYKDRLKFLSSPRKTETVSFTVESYSWENARQTHLILSMYLTAPTLWTFSLSPQFSLIGHVRKPNMETSTELLTVECLSKWSVAFIGGNNHVHRTRQIFPTTTWDGILFPFYR